MVVLIPIALLMPAMFVLVPPAMVLAPAAFTRQVQFAAFVIGLTAVAAVAINRLMQFVFSMHNPSLASVRIFRVRRGRQSEHHQSRD